MPHDNTLAILISTTDDETGTSVFHFMHIDGNGKPHHSPHYQTANLDELGNAQQALIDQWITYDEVKDFRARIKRNLRATRYN